MRRVLLRIIELVGLGFLAAGIAATIVALRHLMETPQPLESILPGEARIYRWKHGHIYYKVLGAEDAPPLLLLHTLELGASSYEMRKIIGTLSHQYRVYAPDLLGFGLSDRPQLDYSAETYITLCHDFLSEVIAAPTILVASGLSGNYAVTVAAHWPELVNRLVLISPIELFGGKPRQELLAELSQVSAIGSLLYPLLSTRTALRLQLARQRQSSQQTTAVSDVDYLYASTHQLGGQHAPMALLGGKLEIDALQHFEILQQPVLIIWGVRLLNETPSITNQHHVSRQTQMVLIQDAGLYVHEEYPSTVVKNIRQWIEESTGKEEDTTTQPVGDEEHTVSEEPTGQINQSQQREQIATVEEHTIQAYCVKCKKKNEMHNPQEVIMKNGRPALSGNCSVCGTKIFRIGRLQQE